MNHKIDLLTDPDFADTVLRAVEALVIVLDPEGRIVFFNNACEELSGISEEDTFGCIPADLFISHEMDNALKGEFPCRFETEWQIQDGSKRMISWSNTALYKPNRSIKYIIATGIDITGRKQMEAQLHAKEQSFRDFAESSSDWFWEMDENLKFTRITKGNRFIANFDPNQFLGKTRQEALGEEADQDKWRQHLIDLENHRPFHDYVYEMNDKDGKRMVVRINGRPVFSSAGVFCGYRGTGTDITEKRLVSQALQESEQAFRQLAELSPLSIQELDVKGHLVYCNQAHTDMTGYSKEESIGQGIWELLPLDSRQELKDYLDFIVKNQPDPEPYFTENQNKNGETYDVQSYWTYKRDRAGKLVGFISLTIDITTRIQAERELKAAKEDAEHANEAKSEFLAHMSHELRTPLNAILGFAQMLQLDPSLDVSKNQADYIDNIITGGEHLLELVSEILDLARVEANQLDLSLDEIEANEIVASCVALTAPLGESHKVTIIDNFSNAPLQQLRTDSLRFKQVLINLISNAVKFNRDGGTVTIEGRVTDNDFLRLSVTDTGVGIAREDFKSLFHMFHRLGANSMVAREGTGIGLTVSKLLVDKMAGRMGLESEVGSGSTFWIELPLADNKEVLIWNNNLQIDVDVIDKDHEGLVALLNRVTQEPANMRNLGNLVDELIEYTRYHFQREETVMEVCRYPEIEKHRLLHRDLIARVDRLSQIWRENQTPETLKQFQTFLRDWLFDHIIKVDTGLAYYARGNENKISVALGVLARENNNERHIGNSENTI